jgi:hypothetical protein
MEKSRVIISEIYLALLESAARHSVPFDGHGPEDHTLYSVFETRSDSWNDFPDHEGTCTCACCGTGQDGGTV